jgi:hypothetical protein
MCNAPDDRVEYLKQLDRELRQMIEQARQYSIGSQNYNRIFHRVMVKMQQSGEIALNGNPKYQDDLLKTWAWFGRKYCTFDPDKAKKPDEATVIGWFKSYLFKEKKHSKKSSNSPTFINVNTTDDADKLDALLKQSDPILNPWLPPLEQSTIGDLERRELVDTVRNCVQQCNRLRAKCVPNRPDVHCQMLLLRLLPVWDENSQSLIPEQSFEQLAQEFQIEKRQLKECCNSYLRDKSCQNSLRNCLESCRSLLS